MLIAATADLHFTHTRDHSALERLIGKMNDAKADALVVAGDFANQFNPGLYDRWLPKITFNGPKIAVIGNHDLWHDEMNTWDVYREACGILRRHGWHVLDELPVDIGDVRFVGNVGWYDYSFFPKATPELDGDAVAVGRAHPLLRIGCWKDVRRYVPSKRLPGVTGWNDAIYVHWGRNDESMASYFVERLWKELDDAKRAQKKVVAVIHHLPFEQLVTRKGTVNWDFNNAFTGSKQFGDLLLKYDNVKLALCGHTHKPQQARVGHIECAEVSYSPRDPQLRYFRV